MSDDDFNCIEFLQQEKAHVIRRGFPGLAEGFDKCIENLQQLAAAKRDADCLRTLEGWLTKLGSRVSIERCYNGKFIIEVDPYGESYPEGQDLQSAIESAGEGE